MRISWIDITRGIGIIFIVYGHTLGSNSIRYYFYSFHIPLFFFLSGLLFKDYGSSKTFFKKSFFGLLVPYFIFAFLSFLIWVLQTSPSRDNLLLQFFSIFYGNSNNGLLAFNNILWFLPTLFLVRIIFYLLQSLKKNIFPILILFSFLGFAVSVYFSQIKLPFGLETALSTVVFYGLGFVLVSKDKFSDFFSKYKYLIFPIFLILNIIISTVDFNLYGNQIDMRLGHLHNYFIFYLDAFLGIFAWISFSMILGKNFILETIGRNSLYIFALHPIILGFLFKISGFTPLVYALFSIGLIVFLRKSLTQILSFLPAKFS